MKTLLIILAMTFSAFAQEPARPAWVWSDTNIWTNFGKVFIRVHVTDKDLDLGMNSTLARFREEVASHFCKENDGPCIYFNFKIEQSYWETFKEDGSISYEIYRLYSIKDIYH